MVLATIEVFDGSLEEWPKYEEQLSHFFTASGITEAIVKQATLLTVIGPATYKVLRNLVSMKKPGEVKFSELVKTSEHFPPAPLKIVELLCSTV